MARIFLDIFHKQPRLRIVPVDSIEEGKIRRVIADSETKELAGTVENTAQKFGCYIQVKLK